MKHTILFVALLWTLAAGGSAMLAAPQLTQLPDRPGFPTQARVWVENKGKAEVVPISIENMGAESPPLRVEVMGTTAVAVVPSTVVQARTTTTRQQWDHRTMTVPSGGDLSTALATLGTDGWEAVGFHVTAQGASVVLLKRPR